MREQQFPLAEVRHIANFLQDLKQIDSSDNELVQGIKRDMAIIDAVLLSGDLEQIINCNRQIYATYGNLLLQNNLLYPTNEQSMRYRGFMANHFTLCIIKMTLQKMIYWEKSNNKRQALINRGEDYLLEKALVSIIDNN